jgi:glycosyltransferase involved in cell wall biosynthesis
VRVLHLVSRESQTSHAERSPLRALLTDIPRTLVRPEVIRFVQEDVQSLALRLTGVPVHELALSRRGFSPFALSEMSRLIQQAQPDIIHAWDHSAQLASMIVHDSTARVVWSMSTTQPPQQGLFGHLRLQALLKFAPNADAIVYGSAAAATAHQDAGFPLERGRIVAPGVHPELYKPDFAMRRTVRGQLGIPARAFVIGMYAPFAAHIDHAALLAAANQLMHLHPEVHLVLGGVGVNWSNERLAELLRHAGLDTQRAHLPGDGTDRAALFAMCDVACLCSTEDGGRLDLAAAMLCGVPCIATAIGAQRELLGEFGIGVAPGSVRALVDAVTSMLQMPPDERARMAQRARQHALRHYTVHRTVSRYRRLYFKLCPQAAGEAQSPVKPLPAVSAPIS